MGITPEIMAQLMSQGIDRKAIMNIPGFQPTGKSQKSMKNDPAQQKVQLINLRTFQKLDRKKCPELYGLESFLKKNPDFFVATEAKEFVLKHPKYFPRTMYQRIQPDLNDPLAQLNALSDPKMMQALMMQAQMDPKAMNVLQAQQAMSQMGDPKIMAMLGMDKNTQLAMAAQMSGMDAKMLQAMGLGGIDPKLLGMDPKLMAQLGGMGGLDPKMLSALGFGGMDPKTSQSQATQLAQQQQLQQQQQLAMLGLDPKQLGLAGMDPKTLQAALGMGGLDPKQLAALGLDQNTLMALGLGLDAKSLNSLQQQQKQQADLQAQAMAQMMGGNLDPKYLAALGLGGAALGMAVEKPSRKADVRDHRKTPTPTRKAESPIEKVERPEPVETPTETTPVDTPAETPAEKSPAEKSETDKEATKEDETKSEKGSEPHETTETVEKTNVEETESVKSEKASRHSATPKPVDSKPGSPKPSSSKSGTPRPPTTPQPPQMDQQALQALKSLANADPKSLQASGLDANLLRHLGLSGAENPTKQRSPSTSAGNNPLAAGKIPGMEGLDTETLKALASGDANAIQKIMNTSTASALGMPAQQFGNPLMGGIDPRLLGGVDERTLMALAASGGLGGIDPKMLGALGGAGSLGGMPKGMNENQLLKTLGLDAQTIHMMQQQELLKQQQLAQQMSMFGMGGMAGMGGMDQKTLQMLGMSSGLDPKLFQTGLDQQAQLMAQQQAALGLLGMFFDFVKIIIKTEMCITKPKQHLFLGGFPAGIDASMMQQILGKAPTPSKKQHTPKKSQYSNPSTSVASSMANLDFLKQQEQLLLLAGGLKPEHLMQSPELQMLAAQVNKTKSSKFERFLF